ncbi:ectoine/hydroxyectoine ABC transporter ATP-binding protein EhuA [Mycolicibacterium smegmatis]|uniref:Ectoine/hydroxyectoine ABC transporter, ATP-binding protein n=4 Tax=Mycolicibacterium smegmatis TaxID=1772 RepID=A0R376_MYCS2|nr:ectoine/hydroxyectoine ABC transporter ATP-binding protein EhuA [Mycolicibacterium smegmatis]ABK74313.1 ectoine/hydroxyectoine ABC transporter, ATP-binding protein [Mycolicibacterium smegmatis MC2 155]AFP41669.1 ABC amino acid transporter, ATPase component [Mycolicibacterium smegmatis MC2 155]AIU10395.1 amino acid ABC transporter ATP-binding protein [Mycolicibacterium smegmatis MC2 155]AIU17020.1 amino acid ABC transporter ATP-binding protein [Mycolicibacterium smegmatis]AIU23643.1 amino ac
MVRFENVVKRFGDKTVLDGMNFSVAPGERVTLIGPSGSGKTTILRLLMTLERVTDGVIWVDGEPFTHERRGGRLVPASEKYLRRARRRIGMVFQQFNLFPNMTVIENLMEAPVSVLGLSKEQARARGTELLDKVGMTDFVDAHPTTLSGGQQQRVAIARALAMEPDILLLDEVTSALDPELVVDVLGVLRDIADTTDITMLIVTHEMHFARDVSDRVLMFDKGVIIEDGPPSKIFNEPEHERTRTFLRAVLEER